MWIRCSSRRELRLSGPASREFGARNAEPSQVTQVARSRTELIKPPAAAKAPDATCGNGIH